MGRAAQASIANLSPDAVIREFESLLRELAKEHRDEHSAAAAHA